MNATFSQIRAFRLRAHHLDQKLPPSALTQAAGACGLQNSPPGAWETALFNRVEGCTLAALHHSLYEQKQLLQAWSFRGAPVVFPAGESGVFLTPLVARAGGQPWIYSVGVSAGLSQMQMRLGALLALSARAALSLDNRSVTGKDALDQTLADLVESDLPAGKRDLWRAPSMYAKPGRQTVGGAVVSFMLRPCSFLSLVVFGRRAGASPTFTSLKNWTGGQAPAAPEGDRALARKFLHCYGPATAGHLMEWLGCGRAQALRVFSAAAEEMEPVSVSGKTRYILSADRESLLAGAPPEDNLCLLGAHDPYLDVRDRDVLLNDPALRRQVWKTVANPGAILKGGRVAGIWNAKAQKGALEISMNLFDTMTAPQRRSLQGLAEAYAAFRGLRLKICALS